MNAVIISGFLTGLAGIITQNAWFYWHRKPLRWLSAGLEAAGAVLLTWGTGMSHRGLLAVTAVLVVCVFILAVGGSLAFVAFMAEIRHQGWASVVRRMMDRKQVS